MKKIYYKHIRITSGDQDDAQKAINDYIEEGEDINIISLNVIPERVGVINCDGYALPKYWYNISLVYTSNEE